MDEQISPLISAAAVRHLQQDPDVVVVDARGGADAYNRYTASHVEGAVFMDLETDLSQKSLDAAEGGRHPLPDPKFFGTLLGNKGITPAKHLLVYDDKAGANAAARFWWMMKAAGHWKVQVIDGGLQAMIEAGLPLSKGSTQSAPRENPYPVNEWKLPTADLETVDRVRSDKDYLVIDVRESYRYNGESEPIDLVAGHIPGAINIPYLNNLEANGRFRSADILADQYKKATGTLDSKNVIVHCGSGVTACHTLLAMEVAGLPTPRLYVGSWSEWSRNEKPVAKGPQS